jgi:hypothetical protein
VSISISNEYVISSSVCFYKIVSQSNNISNITFNLASSSNANFELYRETGTNEYDYLNYVSSSTYTKSIAYGESLVVLVTFSPSYSSFSFAASAYQPSSSASSSSSGSGSSSVASESSSSSLIGIIVGIIGFIIVLIIIAPIAILSARYLYRKRKLKRQEQQREHAESVYNDNDNRDNNNPPFIEAQVFVQNLQGGLEVGQENHQSNSMQDGHDYPALPPHSGRERHSFGYPINPDEESVAMGQQIRESAISVEIID